jgi:hypothetical protein
VGTLARAGFVLAPSGVNNEGYPSSSPANGGSTEHAVKSTVIIDSNHVHVNPYPNVSAPGQRAVCEAGKQEFVAGTQIGNVAPNKVASGAEITTRSQNLFGEPYPAATQQALGLTKPAAKKKATTKKKKTKGTHK